MYTNYLANIGRFIPELILVVLMIGLILLEVTYKENEKNKKYIFITSAIGLLVTLVALVGNLSQPSVAIFTNAIVIDPFSTLMKIIMVIGTFFTIYQSRFSKEIYETLKTEYAVMSVGILIGGFLLASANNMLILYIGVETLSILSYVMASFKKNDDRSSEAGLKYVLYGGLSAGIMLFGMSHIFGVLGTIQFAGISVQMQNLSTMQMAILLPSFILFFVGLGYKIATVPFHMWSPDVYEGSPTPVTTFFAIVPKIAGISAIVRVTMIFFGAENNLSTVWVIFLMAVSTLTMTVGNITAINQKSVKRMLAYSSISHAGVMLAAVLVKNEIGNSAIVFYGITYLFMTLVAFYITNIVQDKYNNDHFERFSGLIYRYPFMAIMMAAAMFSLTGLPPFAGFVAKFNIFTTLIKANMSGLAIIMAINSVISAYYYLKIVRLMMLKQNEANDTIEEFGFLNQLIISILTAPILILGIFWQQILALANGAKIFIN